MEQINNKMIALQIPQHTYSDLLQYAKRDSRSVSAVVRIAIEQFLNKQQEVEMRVKHTYESSEDRDKLNK